MSGIKALYMGDGDYVQGIPARDLTLEEWEAISDEQQERLKELGIFRLKPGRVAGTAEEDPEE